MQYTKPVQNKKRTPRGGMRVIEFLSAACVLEPVSLAMKRSSSLMRGKTS
jgi:hypothetical protein